VTSAANAATCNAADTAIAAGSRDAGAPPTAALTPA
jgi:hypothetical protein